MNRTENVFSEFIFLIKHQITVRFLQNPMMTIKSVPAARPVMGRCGRRNACKGVADYSAMGMGVVSRG